MVTGKYTPSYAVGGTVMLAPEYRRAGVNTVSLKERTPYRVTYFNFSKNLIKVLEPHGEHLYPISVFDPCGCKFSVTDKVRIYSKKRRTYSAVYEILRHVNGCYLLSNGQYYDASVLSFASSDEASTPVHLTEVTPDTSEQLILNL